MFQVVFSVHVVECLERVLQRGCIVVAVAVAVVVAVVVAAQKRSVNAHTSIRCLLTRQLHVYKSQFLKRA